ncbi:dolichyl-diphosphooligosaccharide--protein glycosyltransferase subunit 2-like isoform X1 [Tripterygium wilfordii]|uniref:dolichyl-diphosphooligosaccharide--protein glycosyltransferase subunit 2-like isoform X1 n=1 Tax=Tripterygium wilfordii TaxID=458696 RepID=UPI0018F841AD|nr:dolichyl-diphosphooligosaccharide--protein glycosyltransferase subunit 2-like isoform X1 [Tripterygium wilfordii]XP_038693280.1 dolichyl-diphosphooligosaccharide--protein glycosyltransferase subunit 2-like isoform X1 [Tripterygium wilfordii]XP_038693281.1 dolichyl-diphosphooligosaccharide--protein glycosyltransferase subunit 2-like isoform X1 [Tripterygium wilfordii]
MAGNQGGFLVLILTILICLADAVIFQPISDSHRSAAVELFTAVDGSFGSSLEDTYEALRTFEILGIDRKADVATSTCRTVSETLVSSSSPSKDLFHALKVNGILRCNINDEVFEGIILKLQAEVNDSSSLLDFYYSVGSLVLIKDQTSKVDLHLADAEGVFRSIKALSQSDGRWRYSSNNPESGTFAAGLALEALAGVVSLASSEIDQSSIRTTKNDIMKLFDSIEKYDDGAFYFDEKVVDALEHKGPLSTTYSVVRGLTAFAAVTSGSLNLPKDQVLGLAKFFLAIGIPGDARDFFNQVDALAYLENNRVSIPLILSLPDTVLSLTKKDLLKVRVNTVLGSNAPSLSVKLIQVVRFGNKGASIVESQELKFDPESAVYFLEALPESLDVGHYTFVFEVVLHDSEHKKVYATGGHTQIPIFVTGFIITENAEIAVLESDLESGEPQNKLDLAGENIVSLSANHLQKLRLSFQLTTPLGHAFKPHQAVLKLRHETKVEHIFLVANSGKQFEIILDFLGLVEKFFYLSGKYDIQLTVGDSVMENSFFKEIGFVELDLPEAPEKAPRPPPEPVDPYSRYGPKAEITHIFRAPEKRPPKELSLVFLGLTALPFIGFLVGLLQLGVNLKNFPSSAVPAAFAVLFHLGIGAVLLLYVLFWWKLDLFTTLKTLGFLGVFLIFVGHRILSHLASTSAKLKSA